ncbi:hypothetical protein C7N83_07225 [Neisseria iguanae]|uniref:Uncharacterized protein n=1 Tax=Neisseria iguanae TaxID=90242 RepID=A0A2P7TZY7_9NEIS|nr:hypothetical protein C7N83_07225 [Neisseria iguanae]
MPDDSGSIAAIVPYRQTPIPLRRLRVSFLAVFIARSLPLTTMKSYSAQSMAVAAAKNKSGTGLPALT